MRNLNIVINFERFEISERDRSKLKVLTNSINVRNFKFLAQQFGQLFIKNVKKNP